MLVQAVDRTERCWLVVAVAVVAAEITQIADHGDRTESPWIELAQRVRNSWVYPVSRPSPWLEVCVTTDCPVAIRARCKRSDNFAPLLINTSSIGWRHCLSLQLLF